LNHRTIWHHPFAAPTSHIEKNWEPPP
jgi:hypothetical protein